MLRLHVCLDFCLETERKRSCGKLFISQELWVTVSLATPRGDGTQNNFDAPPAPCCSKLRDFKARTFMNQALTAPLPSLSFPVPAIEDFSVSPSVPRTTSVATTTAVSTARGQAVTTVAGADPRDGRDPFEDNRGSVTEQPTVFGLPPTPRRFCEATRRRAIDWPQSHTGNTVERPCPKGTRGGPNWKWCFIHALVS